MVLVIVTIVCIAALIATLAIFLFIIGVLLNRIADNLDDCLGNVKTIAQQAEPVISGVEHINRTGGVVAGALPLLYGGAEKIAAKLAVGYTLDELPNYITSKKSASGDGKYDYYTSACFEPTNAANSASDSPKDPPTPEWARMQTPGMRRPRIRPTEPSITARVVAASNERAHGTGPRGGRERG